MDTYVCTRCESRLPASDFSWSNRDSRSGKRYRYSLCKRCTVEKVNAWRRGHPEKARAASARKRERIKNDPQRHAHMREVENTRRRSKTKRGEHVQSKCKRCGADFEYEFIQRSRDLCDLCRGYYSDWKSFGLTGPEAAALRARKRCDICGRLKDPGGRFNNWHIDHDHASDKVRGLLCAYCNTVLGLMGHDPARLRAAADYLEV